MDYQKIIIWIVVVPVFVKVTMLIGRDLFCRWKLELLSHNVHNELIGHRVRRTGNCFAIM